MTIRLEQPKDWREVENLTREAFWNVYRPGCQEHFVLNQFRSNPAFIPELDFVMEEDGIIIGHIMFSKAEIKLIDGSMLPSWTFGPISIHPDYKRKGYGLKLLQYALEKARAMGIGLLQMEGNIDFYKHAGFDLASKLRIHYHGEPAESEVPYFLAQELIPGYWGEREGTYCPPAGYFVADAQPEAFAAYEASFPAREKHLLPGQLPQFCQGCGMPLTKDEDCGHNADGSIDFDYCQYCAVSSPCSNAGEMETDRFLLRPWLESDAPVLYKYASDPEVGPRAGWPPHKSVEESLEIIRTVFNDATCTWAIVLKETGEPIGAMGYGPSCQCNLPAREGEPLIGYWVARPYWNRGICTEALQLMIDHIRQTTEIKSLISGHFIDNPASGRVMEKCGFVPTGETVVDPDQGRDTPIRVLRLEIWRP